MIRVLQDDQLVLLAQVGLPESQLRPSLPVNEGISEQLLFGRRPLAVVDVPGHPITAKLCAAAATDDGFRFLSYAGAPMLVGERVVGLIGMYTTRHHRRFTDTDLEHLQILAHHIGVAVINDRLYADVERQKNELEAQIAARTQVEGQLREANQRLRGLLDSTSVAIYTARPLHLCHLTAITEQVRQLVGYEAGAFTADSEFWIDHVHPDDRERVLKEMPTVLERDDYTYEYRFRHESGSYVWIRDAMTLRRDDSGNPIEIVGYWIDITERKRAEQAFRKADRLAALGTLVAGVAHELNNPLTTVVALSELLARNAALSPEARDVAADVAQEADRCSTIVKDLLGFARIRRLSLAPIQVNDVVRRSLGPLRRTHRFDGVEIVEEYEAELPDTLGDGLRLEQVFVNIIRNAGDALAGVTTGRKLRLQSRRKGDQIRVAFTDNGPGIKEPDRVFDPFYTAKSVGEGTGLGLSVSLGIIREHGGRLLSENTGHGARFTVILPIRDV
ncbi:MAG: PAS domain-containing protein [bacterium]|nr:PAS domain-containing protein [bacterium]